MKWMTQWVGFVAVEISLTTINIVNNVANPPWIVIASNATNSIPSKTNRYLAKWPWQTYSKSYVKVVTYLTCRPSWKNTRPIYFLTNPIDRRQSRKTFRQPRPAKSVGGRHGGLTLTA